MTASFRKFSDCLALCTNQWSTTTDFVTFGTTPKIQNFVIAYLLFIFFIFVRLSATAAAVGILDLLYFSKL